MQNWRDAFGFDGEDLDFDGVHARYREIAMTLPMPVRLN